ncbi:MAG: MrpF/PhaF family protein [Firmicutes bacterium]|nr:MrpF/PhaF family protein [Bacillota bacterium]
MLYTILIVLVLLFLSTIKNLKGSSVWDYLLGINLISTKIIIIIVLFATEMQLDYIIDFAIIYALTGFIGTIFVATFLLNHDKSNQKEEET